MLPPKQHLKDCLIRHALRPFLPNSATPSWRVSKQSLITDPVLFSSGYESKLNATGVAVLKRNFEKMALQRKLCL